MTLKSPHYYAGRAEELRTIASDITHPWSRNALLSAAEDLDEMARQVRILTTQQRRTRLSAAQPDLFEAA